MDAVKFLEMKNRICKKYDDCFECPLGNKSGGCQVGSLVNQVVDERDLVAIVERWAKEHTKTRQSEFLKMFPNASQQDGLLNINPCTIDLKYSPSRGCRINCLNCRKEYWLAEVE